MIYEPIIIQQGTKLPTLTNPGTAADLLAPKQLIDANGNALTGTITTNSASALTASGATVTVPAGYYASTASKSVATATQATPTISVSSTGLITASSTQTAGYVSAGTKSATRQLTTKAAATITPGTTNQTIAAGTYLTGVQTIKGDVNLIAPNIKSGVSIFGVTGTMSSMNIVKEERLDTSASSYNSSTKTLTLTLANSCSSLLALSVYLRNTYTVVVVFPSCKVADNSGDAVAIYQKSSAGFSVSDIYLDEGTIQVSGNTIIIDGSTTTVPSTYYTGAFGGTVTARVTYIAG